MNGPNRNQNNRPRPSTNHNRPQRKPNQGGGGPQGGGSQDRQADRHRGGSGQRSQQQGGQQQGGQQQGGQQQGGRSRRGKRNRNRGGQGAPGHQGQQGQQGQQNQQRQGQKGGGQQRPEVKPIRLQPEFKEIPNRHEIKKYGVIFFDTLQAAKADLATLQQKAAEYDQLNVVVRNEANMDDPDFNQIPKLKLFAGAAWATIHERRNEEGWYDAPR